MFQKLLLGGLLACLCCMAHAQTNSPPDTTALKRHKWELAADLLSLTGKNVLPPASLLLRYNLTTRKGKHRAIRLRVGADYRQDYYQVTESLFPLDKETYLFIEKSVFYTRLGYEWQKTVKRFQHYWGVEAQIQFDKENDNNMNYNKTQDIKLSQIFRLGGVGLVGIKYFVMPRFAISGEANIEIYRAWQFDKLHRITHPIDQPKDRKEFRNDFWVLNFNALYVVQLSYLFR